MSNNKSNKFNVILEKLGIDPNPKTPGAKFFRGVQLITIPLFIIVLASKPYIEEKIQQKKYYNERRLEAIEMEKARIRNEQFEKDHPGISKELENYKKSISSTSSGSIDPNKK